MCLDERACRGSGAEEQAQASNQESTSEREDAVDAQALKAEEGRGDRRNVQGELHASEEP